MANCQRTNCTREATLVDYRPAYLDENGEGDCFGKVVTCEPCVGLSSLDWLAGVDPEEAELMEDE